MGRVPGRRRSARRSSASRAWCSRPGPRAPSSRIDFNTRERNLDVTPFTDQVKDKTTFLFPVTFNAADVTALMNPAIDSVYIGQQPASSLTSLNDQLNDLFTVIQ